MIRPARVEDGRAIARLLEQLGYPGAEEWIEEKVARMLADPGEVLLVWEEDGRVAAFLCLGFEPQIAVKKDFAEIRAFAVDEVARSGGIGRALEERVEELARERDCHLIRVHCHERREQAHAFYFRQGYEESPKYLIKKL